MAYVPRFKWDLFISYPMEAESWTKRFEKDLRDEIALASAKGLEIYFAPKNWQLGGISDEMLEAARNSALFVAVLTKDSLAEGEDPEHRARFLQREMKAFRQSRPVNGRFFPIPLYPIAGSQLSEVMPIENSQAFWNANRKFYFYEDGIPLRLEADTEQHLGQYKKEVQKVAYQLRTRLDEIRSSTEGAFSGKTVLLARNGADSNVAKEWQYIRNMLPNDGATVLPEATSEVDPVKSNAEFEAAAQKVDLFVQLFSSLDDTFDQGRVQLETIERCKSIPVLQWRKKHSSSKTDAAILNSLDEAERRFCEGAHVQTGLLEDFKTEIRDALERITTRGRFKESEPPPPQRPYLYITADTSDLTFARELQTAARKRTVADVMTDDEAKRRDDFEQGLMQASAVVFLHGNAKRQFVNLWLKEFVRKQIHSRFAERTWLYQAPPEKTIEDEPLKPIELRVEGSQKEFTLEGIERICAELCSARDR
jgi:hypothetical protein